MSISGPKAPDQSVPTWRSRAHAVRDRLACGVAELGPGLITGAADDDPSGISTYSTAGAQFGYSMLWTTLFSFPLMASVQTMCARIGLVSGQGLASVLRRHYPRWVVWSACLLLLVANTVNIAADLGGMADALTLLTGVRSIWFHCFFAVAIVALLVFSSYHAMARVFKWLTLVLLVYVGAAILAQPRWDDVVRATVVPSFSLDRAHRMAIVAILGTTISPYLFFWQAAQEVEDRKTGATRAPSRPAALASALAAARRDTILGMFFSNAIAFFIMLTTGATLFAAGGRDILSAQDAAAALRPLAGDGAALLFTLGLVGTGMLGIPVLAGSTAYAIAEAGGWGGGMDDRPRQATKFYGVIAVGMLLAMALQHMGVGGFRLLFWAAIVNGLLAPPLIALILLVCNNRNVMGDHVNGRWLNGLGLVTALVMTAAAVAVIVAW